MDSRIISKEVFIDQIEWKDWLEEHEFEYEHLDDDTIIYFLDK